MVLSIHFSFGDFHHNRALHTLFEQLAAVFVDTLDVAGGVVGVCRAAAAAIKPCPAGFTFFSCVDIAQLEFVLYFVVIYAVVNIAELVFIVPDKLVAGIQISLRCDRHIFST